MGSKLSLFPTWRRFSLFLRHKTGKNSCCRSCKKKGSSFWWGQSLSIFCNFSNFLLVINKPGYKSSCSWRSCCRLHRFTRHSRTDSAFSTIKTNLPREVILSPRPSSSWSSCQHSPSSSSPKISSSPAPTPTPTASNPGARLAVTEERLRPEADFLLGK